MQPHLDLLLLTDLNDVAAGLPVTGSLPRALEVGELVGHHMAVHGWLLPPTGPPPGPPPRSGRGALRVDYACTQIFERRLRDLPAALRSDSLRLADSIFDDTLVWPSP